MARRVHAVCTYISDEYDDDAAAVWLEAASADDMVRSLKKLPGFGDYKATLTASVLVERFAVKPEGWETIGFDNDMPVLSEVGSPDELIAYKERKKAWKAAKKG